MYEIVGLHYDEVALRDGSTGNYEIAQHYYRAFNLLAKEQPENFNRICSHIHADPDAMLTVDDVRIVRDGEDGPRVMGHHFSLVSRPEDEIKKFVLLSVKQDGLSHLFSALSLCAPFYHLVSPFKNPGANPDEVRRLNRKRIHMDWIGSDLNDYPGNKLHL